MTTPRQGHPGPGQVGLWTEAERPAGRHERELDAAVAAASLTGRYLAGVSAARAGARALDEAERAGKPQTTAQILPSYLDTLGRLGLLPDPSVGGAPMAGDEGSGAGLAKLLAVPTPPERAAGS